MADIARHFMFGQMRLCQCNYQWPLQVSCWQPLPSFGLGASDASQKSWIRHCLLFLGSNKSLKPYMLAAHQDVVPVETQVWDYPQFKAHIEDGFIYGRGTIDNKQSVMVIFYSYFKILVVLALPFRTDSDITNWGTLNSQHIPV